MRQILIIGFTWPERTTAAGTRMMQLIRFFKSRDWDITFASTAAETEYTSDLEKEEVQKQQIRLNDPHFDTFNKDLNPEIVLFDRFLTEEQFGWRVAENCPDALRILDTEDLHFLRKVREEAYRKNKTFTNSFLFSDTAKRELASILRCDLSLIISEVEMQLLQKHFKIDPALLFYLPFLVNSVSSEEIQLPAFEDRKDFIFLGNYLHKPNAEAVMELRKAIWPLISSELPDAELHCYGAYASEAIKNLHQPKDRFFMNGWVENVSEEIRKSRVMLAPLRFGAGLKGKLIQVMQCGTPAVTTKIGAEGIPGNLPWNGFIEENPERFAGKAIQLYNDEIIWQQSRQNGYDILEKRFSRAGFEKKLYQTMEDIISNLNLHRQNNFMGALLSHHSMQSTKYLSKWIEEKNKTS